MQLAVKCFDVEWRKRPMIRNGWDLRETSEVIKHDLYMSTQFIWYKFRGWKTWGYSFLVGSRITIYARGNLQVHFACMDSDSE